MTIPDREPWLDANQRYLIDVVEALQARMEAHRKDETSPTDFPELTTNREEPPALETLAAAFGLSSFERLLLALCAGVELDAKLAGACADASNSPRRSAVTFGFALALLPDGHWSALSPARPLRRWRMIEVASGDSLTTSALKIDERVLHHLTGVSYLDDRLDGLVAQVAGESAIAPSHLEVAERAAAIWTNDDAPTCPAIQLCGPDPGSKTAIAAAVCERLGLGLLRLRAEHVPLSPGERRALSRLCERELALSGNALLLVCEGDTRSDENERSAMALAEEMVGPLIVATPDPLQLEARPKVRLDVPKLDHDEQRHLWQSALGPMADTLDGQLDALVSQFNLDSDGIRAASSMLESSDAVAADLYAQIWDSCRVQARRRLDGLAQRIDSRVGWDDLVLPEPQERVLRDIARHVRNCRTVYETWGFASKNRRGLGISALFAGPSGTGKTLAAEVLANELHLDLYRIDLSQVVSKYIGETEKNLRRIFDAAEQSGAILLFDEADALFGKRSEVKDSHDRYANIEVSYLLQRMEAYRGLAVLTTNMRSALDHAFLRRIRFILQFPFPDATQREEIWRRVFPKQTPTENLDLRRLARMNVAGGNIRNIAVNAAFLAADSRGPVVMSHVVQAAHAEYAKLEKPLTAAELGGLS